MIYRLMNSAMMPAPGTYTLRKISAKEFFGIIVNQRERVRSYIGYPQNLDFIARKTGIRLPLSREITQIEDGDRLIIMKLRYRTEMKGHKVSEGDFEFFIADYTSCV